MDQQEKALRIGAAVIACAIVFRLAAGGFFAPAAEFLRQPDAVAFLMFLETGRVARYGELSLEEPGWTAESPPPMMPNRTEPSSQAVFSGQDLDLVDLRSYSSYEPDLELLLTQPLDMELREEGPTVLILHSHTTESYTKTAGQNYEESSSYRTLDEDYNLLRVGQALAEKLEAAGIHTIQDRTLHDYPSYTGAYDHARSSVQDYLSRYPSIRLVLDLHRDAVELSDGSQMDTAITLEGKEGVQLMLVMGTGENGQDHPHWQENLSLALKLHAQLERSHPGIMRTMSLRTSRFNQDLHPNMLLVEVGAAGDTLQGAVNAMAPLAEAIIALSGA